MHNRQSYRVKWLAALAMCFLLVSPTLGQDVEGERGQGRGRRGNRMQGMADRLAEQLELDEDQRAQFDQIVAEQREQWQEIRQQRRAIREAEEAGDEDAAAELRAMLPERGQGGQNRMSAFFDRIEPILRDDQLEQLAEVRERAGQWGMGRRGGQRGGPGMGRGPGMGGDHAGRSARQMDNLAEQLSLDDEQRPQFEEARTQFGEKMGQQHEQMREIGPMWRELRTAREAGDDAAVEELQQALGDVRSGFGNVYNEFYEDVKLFLRDDQIETLDTFREERQDRRNRFGDRRGRDRNRFGEGHRRQAPPNSSQVLSNLEETLDFSSMLVLNNEQRRLFDKTVEATRGRLGDDERVNAKLVDQMFTDLKKTLSEDQIRSFGGLQEQVRRSAARDPETSDLRLVFSAARRVKLSDEQSRQLRGIHKDAARQYRQARRDRGAQGELAVQTKKRIVDMLNAEQVERFEQQLQRLERRRNGARRNERGT